ncbi:UDP-glycosyltransferase 75C1-like [Benincasa hispida]|uniref:UDP-glycosyltransferase 75C1-like n=1 Tax=Benincasa hispida TaxID=102211 RepID=UPI001902B95F|nr:UDP-glycosyltransferase 75C1-like [Benincasa hispida]
MEHGNFLLVSQSPKSHLNPTLHLASTLLSFGSKVTLLLTNSALKNISKDQLPYGLSLSTFSDGFDDGFTFSDFPRWCFEFERLGRLALVNLLSSSLQQGLLPFTCIVHTLLIPWVARVARELHVPTAVLWIQSAAAFDVYYYYFNGYSDVIWNGYKDEGSNSLLFNIWLPGLPLMNVLDLPSFMVSDDYHGLILKSFQEKMQVLEEEENVSILVNSFDALEHDALSAIGKFNLIPVGPLVSLPLEFEVSTKQRSTSYFQDGQQAQADYIKWLNSKPDSSVVYIAFGSISKLSNKQTKEIVGALLECSYPFLWALRMDDIQDENLSSYFDDELQAQGKIVPWCSQVEVLSHHSVGCFVTHCGWNSTIESVAAGVPMVAWPLWADQATNAKMMEDVWEIGVRVKKSSDGEGVVEGKEIARCLRTVMDMEDYGKGRGKQLRINARKWQSLAMEAANGSSYMNLKAFVNKLSDQAN